MFSLKYDPILQNIDALLAMIMKITRNQKLLSASLSHFASRAFAAAMLMREYL